MQGHRTAVLQRLLELHEILLIIELLTWKKNGVLQAYRTVVNLAKFGYINFHVFIQMKQPTKDVFNEFIKKIKAYPFLRAIIQFNGKYDLELALVGKNMADCDRIMTQIYTDCHNLLHNHEVLFVTKSFIANTFPKSFLDKYIEKDIKRDIKKYNKPENISISIDETDIKLLEILSENAEIPVYKIAEQIRLSADAVTYRIKKLQKSNYIIGYVPAINYDVINYGIYAVLISIVNFTQKDDALLTEFFKNNKDVLWAVKAIGKYNVIAYFCTQKMDDFIKTTEELRNYLTNKVQDYELLINFEEYKYTYLPKGLIKINWLLFLSLH